MGETEKTLSLMTAVFGTPDKLLRQVGMITLYYHLFRFSKLGKVGAIERPMLMQFEKKTRKESAFSRGEG